jgi:hypothetical protein
MYGKYCFYRRGSNKIKFDYDKGKLSIPNLIKMCSLDSEMRTDGHDSVLSFHASYAKNVQRKTGEQAA